MFSILDGRKAKIWLDVEDTCQKGLGITLICIIQACREVIEGAGLEFGAMTVGKTLKTLDFARKIKGFAVNPKK